MISKSELYLKNFDLLNVEPAVSLSLHMDNDLNVSSFRTILSLCKQWYIKHINIQSNGIINQQFLTYLQQSINDQFLFEQNDFIFSFEINGIPYELLRTFLQEKEPMVFPLLIHTGEYETTSLLWGKEFVRFTGSKPEVYRLQVRKKKINLQLTNARHIVSVLASPERNPGVLVELSGWLDRQTGNLSCT